MKRIILIILFASCGTNRNEIMTDLLNKQKNLNDSLEHYKKMDFQAKFAVDTLRDSDLLRLGSQFLEKQNKIRMELIPKIVAIEKEIKAINYSIDSLSKMK